MKINTDVIMDRTEEALEGYQGVVGAGTDFSVGPE